MRTILAAIMLLAPTGALADGTDDAARDAAVKYRCRVVPPAVVVSRAQRTTTAYKRAYAAEMQRRADAHKRSKAAACK